MTNIRIFNEEEDKIRTAREEVQYNNSEQRAHDLLGKNKKILIVGDCQIKKEEIQGICKEFGFGKKDIEFEIDYKKVTGAGSRFLRSGRYEVIIFGKLPHKVAQMGDWSNCIEKMKQEEFGPYPVDARTKAGELNVTKTSFKAAMTEVCNYLKGRMEVAC